MHCMRGNSRSVSVVLCYMMKYHEMSLRDAYKHVKGCRPKMHPVQEVQNTARQIEKELYGKNDMRFEFYY